MRGSVQLGHRALILAGIMLVAFGLMKMVQPLLLPGSSTHVTHLSDPVLLTQLMQETFDWPRAYEDRWRIVDFGIVRVARSEQLALTVWGIPYPGGWCRIWWADGDIPERKLEPNPSNPRSTNMAVVSRNPAATDRHVFKVLTPAERRLGKTQLNRARRLADDAAINDGWNDLVAARIDAATRCRPQQIMAATHSRIFTCCHLEPIFPPKRQTMVAFVRDVRSRLNAA